MELDEPAATRPWRLFIAHPVPESVRVRLWEQLRPYRDRHADVRWTERESWHLTLLFLGSVERDRVPELERLIDTAAAPQPPYAVAIGAGGGRPGRDGGRIRREGVAWLGLGEGAETLLRLADRIHDLCPPDVTTGPPPRRTLSAHLTVVRRADGEVIAALRSTAHGPLEVGWTVDRLCLVRSHLGRGGARYETVHEAAL